MSKGNDGVWLQDELAKALKAFCERTPACFHRFQDTKAARGFLPAQPGDYFWLVPGASVLIECKSTDRSAPLERLLEPGQCGKHRLWHRAGHPSAFVYGDRASGALRWHAGRSVLGPKGREAPVPMWEGRTGQCLEMLLHVATKVAVNL